MVKTDLDWAESVARDSGPKRLMKDRKESSIF